MSVTTITVQTAAVSITGLEATYEAGALTMEFLNSGRQFIHVKNGATDAILTISDAGNCSQGADHSQTVTCTASEERFIGPFPTGEYNDANGKVQFAINDIANVTIAVVTLPLAGLGG